MSMKYEIGTKVKIRTDLETDKLYNGIDFSIDMKPYMGKEAKIVDCNESAYFLDIDNRFWTWGEKMLESCENSIVSNRSDLKEKLIAALVNELGTGNGRPKRIRKVVEKIL